jgi:hypothetical protein
MEQCVRLGRIVVMMSFLQIDDFILESYGLPLIGDLPYRAHRRYRFSKHTRDLGYTAWDGDAEEKNPRNKVIRYGIPTPELFLNRIYFSLKHQCLELVKKKKSRSNVKYIDRLLLVFGGVDFLLSG